jgi:hypothetical protein
MALNRLQECSIISGNALKLPTCPPSMTNGLPSTISRNLPAFFTSCGIGLLCAKAGDIEKASARPIRISFCVMRNLLIPFRRGDAINVPPAW